MYRYTILHWYGKLSIRPAGYMDVIKLTSLYASIGFASVYNDCQRRSDLT